VSSDRVDLDPSLSAELTDLQRRAVQVHVLRARADSIRGPRRGERALVLALRASELEQELLRDAGLEEGAAVLRDMAEHPATLAAIERWRYAQQLAYRIMKDMPE
jgi:hypothetical protein